MIWYISLVALFTSLFQPVKVISLKMDAKTLSKGKTVSAKGEVFFRNADGLLVTHFSYPFEYLVFVNGKGEVKMYDPKNNTVVLRESGDMSSENSFFFQFFNGGTSDMGLKKAGYNLARTRRESTVIITEWIPKDSHSPVGKVELAHDQNIPTAIFIYDRDGKVSQKTFYSKYSKIGALNLPMNVTEITFTSPKDSVISKKWYTEPASDEKVDLKYFNFKIPANAKVVD